MDRELQRCTHTFDDRSALLKESLRKEPWQLKTTCTRCGEMLYPTKGTLTLMGIVDILNHLSGMVIGLCARRILPSSLPLPANVLICLGIFLLSCCMLKALTRPILLVARWQPMDDRIRDVPRENVMRDWYGKTMFRTLISFVIIAAFIYLVVF